MATVLTVQKPEASDGQSRDQEQTGSLPRHDHHCCPGLRHSALVEIVLAYVGNCWGPGRACQVFGNRGVVGHRVIYCSAEPLGPPKYTSGLLPSLFLMRHRICLFVTCDQCVHLLGWRVPESLSLGLWRTHCEASG